MTIIVDFSKDEQPALLMPNAGIMNGPVPESIFANQVKTKQAKKPKKERMERQETPLNATRNNTVSDKKLIDKLIEEAEEAFDGEQSQIERINEKEEQLKAREARLVIMEDEFKTR